MSPRKKDLPVSHRAPNEAPVYSGRRTPDSLRRLVGGVSSLLLATACSHPVPHDKQLPAEQKPDISHTSISDAEITEWASGGKIKYSGTIVIKPKGNTTVENIAKEYYGPLPNPVLDVVEQSIAQNNNIDPGHSVNEGQVIEVFLTDPKVVPNIEGKTLKDIANVTGFDEAALQLLNNSSIKTDADGKIVSGEAILPVEEPLQDGETLDIVNPGDTLYAIARRQNVSPNNLVDRNNLDSSKLRAGQLVIIPKTQNSTTTPVPEKVSNKNQEEITHIIDAYGSYAKMVEGTYKVPHNVVLAQLIRETGWDGSSELSEKAHNFFGIKANSNWNGEIYAKQTMEEVSQADHDEKYPDAEIVEEKPNGNVVILIEQNFRKYTTDEDCFNDYGKKISQPPYVDALSSSDPKEVARKIADRWATDSAYGSALEKIIEQLISSEQSSTPNPEISPSDLERRIHNIDITLQGYEHFKNELVDSSMEKYALSPIMRGSFEGLGVTQLQTTGLVWHRWGSIISGTNFTSPEFVRGVELSEEQRVAAKAIDILGGRGLGINYFMTREGKVFILSNNKVAHIAGHFTEGEYKDQPLNGHLLGVEAESAEEGDLTDKQLSGYIYLAYLFLDQQGVLSDKTVPLDLNKLVYGHGEVSEYRLDPTKNRAGVEASSPRADIQGTTAAALREKLAELLRTQGYTVNT